MTSILVVDDHPFFLHGFSQYLANGYDFTVETALSVDEAIAKLDTVRPDLAMLDVSMQGGGGLRVLGHMRLHYPDIPAMFLTVHVEPEQTIEAMRLGIKGIALKDSDPEIIINGMKAILAGDSLLDFFNFGIVKFNNSTGLCAHHMIVVFTAIELVDGWAIIKIMSLKQTSHFELGEYPVHSCNAHILTSIAQQLIDIFGGHVAIRAVFQHLQNFDPG